jgi:hypothetical protein
VRFCVGGGFKRERGRGFSLGGGEAPASVDIESRRRSTLPRVRLAVPSTLQGFTAVFGMGTGGAPALWPPGNVDRSLRYFHVSEGRSVVLRESDATRGFTDGDDLPLTACYGIPQAKALEGPCKV